LFSGSQQDGLLLYSYNNFSKTLEFKKADANASFISDCAFVRSDLAIAVDRFGCFHGVTIPTSESDSKSEQIIGGKGFLFVITASRRIHLVYSSILVK
jgi:hypothetical protein